MNLAELSPAAHSQEHARTTFSAPRSPAASALGGGPEPEYKQLRANAWNVLLSDAAAFDLGYGTDTVFHAMTDGRLAGAEEGPQGGGSGGTGGAGHGSPRGPRTSTVLTGAAASLPPPEDVPSRAPWQLVNHFPNNAAFTSKASVIRCVGVRAAVH
jgi:hypothetical protein